MTEPREPRREPRCTDWNAARDGHSFECPVRREQERTPPPPIPERGEWDAAVRAAEHRAIEIVEAQEPPLRAERLVAQIHRLAAADTPPPMLGWDPAEQ